MEFSIIAAAGLGSCQHRYDCIVAVMFQQLHANTPTTPCAVTYGSIAAGGVYCRRFKRIATAKVSIDMHEDAEPR
jgi:hypothetical protein